MGLDLGKDLPSISLEKFYGCECFKCKHNREIIEKERLEHDLFQAKTMDEQVKILNEEDIDLYDSLRTKREVIALT